MLNEIFKLVKEVGHIIMFYHSKKVMIDVFYKPDKSPVTKVDKIADSLIKKKLSSLFPDIPVLSEEDLSNWNENKNWDKYWLIDPLDGTKDFLNKRHEFTINIALIKKGTPILGVIYVPFFKTLYYTEDNKAWKEKKGYKKQISVSDNKLPCIALSFYHSDKNIISYLKKLELYKVLKIGSSLKFCLLAEGKIQFYPRFGKTKIWDTAAGDAIVTAAGGLVRTWDNTLLNYFPRVNFCNPGFFAASNKKYAINFYEYKMCY